eukprot:14726619-Ditylum_brightwellii.AAC.1
MVCGRFHNGWAQIQHKYLLAKKLALDTVSGGLWTSSIINYPWEKILTLWDQRNELVHNHENSAAQDRQRQTLKLQVQAVHALYDEVLVAD